MFCLLHLVLPYLYYEHILSRIQVSFFSFGYCNILKQKLTLQGLYCYHQFIRNLLGTYYLYVQVYWRTNYFRHRQRSDREIMWVTKVANQQCENTNELVARHWYDLNLEQSWQCCKLADGIYRVRKKSLI